MKKRLSTFILVLLLISIFTITAQDPPPSIPNDQDPTNSEDLQTTDNTDSTPPNTPTTPSSLGEINPETGVPEKVEEIQEFGEKITDEKKREYLAKEWQNFFLKNQIVSAIDSFLTKINIVFKILFATDYSFTLTFFFITILWIIFAIKLPFIIKDAFGLSLLASTGIGLALTVIIAHTKLFSFISSSFVKFVFYPEYAWLRIITFLIVIIALALIYTLLSFLENYLEKRKKSSQEKKTEQSQEIIEEVAEKLSE